VTGESGLVISEPVIMLIRQLGGCNPRRIALLADWWSLSPRLWPEAARALWAVRRRRWWARRPFLPVPPTEYLVWRSSTAYGDAMPVPVEDLSSFLAWRVRSRRAGR
jgi:hypothetical protein